MFRPGREDVSHPHTRTEPPHNDAEPSSPWRGSNQRPPRSGECAPAVGDYRLRRIPLPATDRSSSPGRGPLTLARSWLSMRPVSATGTWPHPRVRNARPGAAGIDSDRPDPGAVILRATVGRSFEIPSLEDHAGDQQNHRAVEDPVSYR